MNLTSKVDSLVMDINNNIKNRKEYLDYLKNHTNRVLNDSRNQRLSDMRIAKKLRENWILELKADVRELIEKFRSMRKDMSTDMRLKLDTFINSLSADVRYMLDSYKKKTDVTGKNMDDMEASWKEGRTSIAEAGENEINTDVINVELKIKILEYIKESDDGRKPGEIKAMEGLPFGTDIIELLSEMETKGLIKKNKFRYYAK